MRISVLFDVGIRILRRHIRILLAVALAIQLPGAILDAVAQQRLGATVGPLLVGLDTDTPRVLTPTDAQANAILGAILLVGFGMLVSMLLGAIATVAYATVVRRDYHGEPATFLDVAGLAIRRAFAAVAAAILAALAVLVVIASTIAVAALAAVALPGTRGETGGIGIFIALIAGVAGAVLAITLLVRLSLAVIAVAVEDAGPITAVRRSWHLTGDNTWRTFAVLLILAIVVSLLASLLVQAAAMVTGSAGAGQGPVSALDALVAAAVSVLFAPVAVVVQAVLYFDLRVRRDAWDLPAPPAVGDDIVSSP